MNQALSNSLEGQSSSLEARVKRINAAHRAIEARHKKNILDAMAIGDELIEIKAEVPHGQWLDWIKEHCEFEVFDDPDEREKTRARVRVAQQYMQYAEYRPEIEAANANRRSHLTITEARKVVANARKLIAKPVRRSAVEVIPPGHRSEETEWSEEEQIAHGRMFLGLPPKPKPTADAAPEAPRGLLDGARGLIGGLNAIWPRKSAAEPAPPSPAEAEAEAFRDFSQWVVEVFRDLGEPPESIRASLDDIAGWLRQCSDPRKWADDLAALEIEYVEETNAAAVERKSGTGVS